MMNGTYIDGTMGGKIKLSILVNLLIWVCKNTNPT